MSDAEKNSVAAMLNPATGGGGGGAHHHVVPTERCGALNVFIEVSHIGTLVTNQYVKR